MQALMPLGQSTAAAIVCCAIFFVFGVLAIGNLVYSSYAWYDVVIIACFLRTCSYGIRAAYLGGRYTPAMGGVAFAFLNGGKLALQTDRPLEFFRIGRALMPYCSWRCRHVDLPDLSGHICPQCK